MTKVIISTKAKDLREKVMAVTQKCFELKDCYPKFGWDFNNYSGEIVFSAHYRIGDETESFAFPLHLVELDAKYDYIIKQLNSLKWSALTYEKQD